MSQLLILEYPIFSDMPLNINATLNQHTLFVEERCTYIG